MTVQKVIRGDDAGGFSRWEPGQVATPAAKAEQRAPLTVAELEALQKAAYDEGFAQGRQDGLAKGQKDGFAKGEQEARELVKRVRRQLDILAEPLAELDDLVEEQLVRLALSIAQQIIRRELQLQPGEVVAVVREALALLPLGSRNVKVHLHPDDARFLREASGQGDEEAAWKVVEDAAISRGGCRVESVTSQIDATLERRLAVLASELLGGIRSGEVEEPES